MSATERARDAAFWLASSFVKRRLYASDSASVRPNLERLLADLAAYFTEAGADAFSIGAMAHGVSLGQVPVLTPPDVVSRFAAHMRQRGFGVLNLSRGVTLAELETLIALLNLDAVEVAAMDVEQWLKDRGAEHVAVKHLEIAETKVARSMGELYSMGEETLSRQLKRVTESGGVELGAVKEFAGTLLDMVAHSDVPIATMVALRNRDDYSFKHSVNVSLLAGAQASSLGLAEDLVREISIAGLLHDVGKTMVPEAVLQKKTPLTPAERQLLRGHPEDGARILLRSHGSAGLEAIVAAEHHLPFTENPHLASQLVAVADAFDTIRTLCPFSTREALRPVLNFMFERMGNRLNPYLVQRFAVMCGMYVAGDVVTLTTGETARVVATHAEFGTKPVLEVIDAARGTSRAGTLVDLSQARTQTTIHAAGALEGLTLDAIDTLG